MATQKLTLGGGRFSTSNSTVVGNDTSTCIDSCAPGEDYLIAIGNGSWDNAHTSDPSNKGQRPGRELNALVQHAEHIGGS
jgi:hypothetical protein